MFRLTSTRTFDMNCVDLFYSALSDGALATGRRGNRVELPYEPYEDVCCLTGTRQKCIQRKDCIGENFTTQSVFAAPDSDSIGVRAFFALKHGKESLSSWIVSEDALVLLNRTEALSMILCPPTTKRWAAYITTSYKKHGCLVAPVNNQGSARVAFETEVVDIHGPTPANEIYSRLRYFMDAGIPRAALQGGPIDDLAGGPPLIWIEFKRWSDPLAKSGLYRLVSHLLPGRKAGDPEKIHWNERLRRCQAKDRMDLR